MNVISATALLLAGSFFCFPFGKVKENVTIGGAQVGGLSYAQAEQTVRERLCASLSPVVIHAPSGDLVLDGELALTDDIARAVRRAGKGENLTVRYKRTWASAEEELLALCARNAKEAKNAEMSFTSQGFCYKHEVPGVACGYEKLLRDVFGIMQTGGEATLSVWEYPPEITEELLRERTRELSRFTTYFDGSNSPRRHNIALAASRIAGTVIGPGESFSFNEAVGKRTRSNGFRVAAVISDGEFVPGVGGGVCQTSTTLFGAALRAGLEIAESRPHSLAVEYAEPSQDAMVSEYSDLKLKNPYPFPVYLLATAGEGEVSFSVYGKPDGRRYEVESRVLFTLDPPPAKVVDGTENRVLRAPRRGLASESTLLCYEGETLIFRRVIRRDTYACVQGVEERIPAAEDILEDESADF